MTRKYSFTVRLPRELREELIKLLPSLAPYIQSQQQAVEVALREFIDKRKEQKQ